MSVEIVDLCVNCWACVDVCPSDAISASNTHMLVNAKKCTECEGDYADPQCASICPIESAILDSGGFAINPPGSLTGIPPETLAEAMNEIQAR
ncbi:4Fe-4S binding protein [Sessilibacter corallicola]|uniref:4Fe-4S binding protein n=1 Tax=Sessilibacter corallicola TaxID=2904075 RepID=UPI001E57E8E3|nr:4Fe-4S binding protein [Sessilibacter corallicola]MCE2029673.1 4Fe-4S binding protein [Sessilibacter corallicola]